MYLINLEGSKRYHIYKMIFITKRGKPDVMERRRSIKLNDFNSWDYKRNCVSILNRS